MRDCCRPWSRKVWVDDSCGNQISYGCVEYQARYCPECGKKLDAHFKPSKQKPKKTPVIDSL